MQLFDLKVDRGEQKNLLDEHPERVATLLRQLNREVKQGRSTSGNPVSNDRDVTFLPKGVALPVRE